MADPLAVPSDVAGLWRPLTAAEETVTENLVVVASAIIRRALPSIDTWISEGTLDATIAAYVVTEMVKNSVESGNRPAGAKSVAEGIGPYNQAITYDAASRLALTGDLLVLLAPIPKASSALGSIRLKPGLVYYGYCR